MKKKNDTLETMAGDVRSAELEISKLVDANATIFRELTRLVDKYNTVAVAFHSEIKESARASQKAVSAGGYTAKPTVGPEWDLDAVERVVADEEFHMAVKIEYKLKTGGIGDSILRSLMDKYPELKKLRSEKVSKVTAPEPKPIELGSIARAG